MRVTQPQRGPPKLTRSTTYAGRVGRDNDRNVRAAPWWPQNGQVNGCPTVIAPGPIATGASHDGQAHVASAS